MIQVKSHLRKGKRKTSQVRQHNRRSRLKLHSGFASNIEGARRLIAYEGVIEKNLDAITELLKEIKPLSEKLAKFVDNNLSITDIQKMSKKEFLETMKKFKAKLWSVMRSADDMTGYTSSIKEDYDIIIKDVDKIIEKVRYYPE